MTLNFLLKNVKFVSNVKVLAQNGEDTETLNLIPNSDTDISVQQGIITVNSIEFIPYNIANSSVLEVSSESTAIVIKSKI